MANDRIFLGLCLGRDPVGVECALAAVAGRGERMKVRLIGHRHQPLPAPLRERLRNAAADFAGIRPGSGSAGAGLEHDVSGALSHAARATLESLKVPPAEIVAAGVLGCVLIQPGQPPRRAEKAAAPSGESDTTVLELGSPAAVATAIGRPAVGDFARSAFGPDGSLAGLPWADWLLLHDRRLSRVRVHLGDVAALTFVPADCVATDLVAFDAGPGMMLLDSLAERLLGRADPDGAVAAKGTPSPALLHELLSGPYFLARPPKLASSALWGALFLDRLEMMAQRHRCAGPQNLLATAAEFAARAIASAVGGMTERPHEVILSGPGATNIHLATRIRLLLSPSSTYSSERYGLPIQARSPVNCAVLAAARVDECPLPMPEPHGQWRQSVFGGLYLA